ncbi:MULTISPECIES: YoaK family protein [unclassified Pseudoalteromonas]|uniref:YoaK family protein n=1 Tax=unclassified Pseudoalteromonas TaxID=194690 RepID=UPI0025725CF1|nr:YoaK family protein [Pseudoalteromonas sp. MM1]BED88240.1 membrane protein [Pseudoalteromonas sp. MM1]
MLTKLPKWVEYGAFTLAFIAGVVNAVGLLGFEHQAISHLSGSVTLLGIKLMSSTSAALLLISIIVSFMLGSALSGFLLTGGSLKLGRHYDTLLFIEGLLLLLSAYLLDQSYVYGITLASAACGLQNALATNYSGAVVRTTHLTGIFTDLGLMIGKALKGETFDTRKGVMFLLIIIGFLLGGITGFILFEYSSILALVVPALACFVLSVTYRVYRIRAL